MYVKKTKKQYKYILFFITLTEINNETRYVAKKNKNKTKLFR